MTETPDPLDLLRTVLGLAPAERAAVLAQCDPHIRESLADATDWSPLTTSETHRAFQVATACIAARYYRLTVRFAELIEEQEPRHLIWALAELLAQSLRDKPAPAVAAALQMWGAIAAEGIGDADLPDEQIGS